MHLSAFTPALAFLQMPSMPELLVIALIGLLFFGKRLPEVGKSLGKGIIEFKKGLKGVEDEVEDASSQGTTRNGATILPPQAQQPVAPLPPPAGTPAPKYDPYTGQPLTPLFDPQTGKPVG